MSQFSLRLPDSVMEEAKRLAEDDQVSLNQFFLAAISEKLGELKTRKFFQQRAAGADFQEALNILDSLPMNEAPDKGDEIE